MSPEWNQVILPKGWSLEVVDSIDSTNAELKRRAAVTHGTVLLAEQQTAGRGRRGAVWYAVPGESLAFSVGLRPEVPRALWPRMALAAGLAVAEAVAKLGLEAEVKWPNDVLIRGRKLCGILVEATHESAIVGIGLNVGQEEFDGELQNVATSIRREGRADIICPDLLGLVLAELSGWCGKIGSEFPSLLRRLRERCALTGQVVRLVAGDGPHQGRVLGLGDAGELVVETENGTRSFLQADEVRRVP
jgi:BirA family biotin operon repressor/biotin-[acetyl-CoA-carboxylase] ligase